MKKVTTLIRNLSVLIYVIAIVKILNGITFASTAPSANKLLLSGQPFPDTTVYLGSMVKIYLGHWPHNPSKPVTYSVVSDNSNLALLLITNDTLYIKSFARGLAILTITAQESNGNSLSTSFTLTINPLYERFIQGIVAYDNSRKTALKGVFVSLSPGGKTASTNQNGEYTFFMEWNGTFEISAAYNTMEVISAINNSDALMCALYFLDPVKYRLSHLRYKAADVNNDSKVNNTDALLIQRRFLGLDNAFPSGNWIFEKKTVVYRGEWSLKTDILGLLIGDVNGSYIP